MAAEKSRWSLPGLADLGVVQVHRFMLEAYTRPDTTRTETDNKMGTGWDLARPVQEERSEKVMRRILLRNKVSNECHRWMAEHQEVTDQEALDKLAEFGYLPMWDSRIRETPIDTQLFAWLGANDHGAPHNCLRRKNRLGLLEGKA
jgi:hypothetical protein